MGFKMTKHDISHKTSIIQKARVGEERKRRMTSGMVEKAGIFHLRGRDEDVQKSNFHFQSFWVTFLIPSSVHKARA